MRKLVALLSCAAILMTGCSSDQLTETLNQAADTVASVTESTPEPTPTPTPAPVATELELGKKGNIGDWKVCVKKAETKKKIKNGQYRYFEAGKGNKFVIVSMSVSNNGKESGEFLPRVGYEDTMIAATLYYEDEYEYKPTQLLSYDKDLAAKDIQPLSTEKGVIAFEVPNKVAKNKKNLKLKIGTSTDYLVYSLK